MRKKPEPKPIPQLCPRTVIEISDGRELLLDGCLGLLSYDETRIILKISHGSLCITGRALVMRSAGNGRMIINGRLFSVSFPDAEAEKESAK